MGKTKGTRDTFGTKNVYQHTNFGNEQRRAVDGINTVKIKSLSEVMQFKKKKVVSHIFESEKDYRPDFSDI